jgi:hypothetical protein
MDSLFYLLPLIFGVVGWATTHVEFYAMGGALSFFTAYTIISEGATGLTNSDVFLSIVYAVMAVSLLLRVVISNEKEGGA